MIVKYRSHTFTVPDTELIVMGDSFYAKVDLGQRGQSFPHYIKVTPPVAVPAPLSPIEQQLAEDIAQARIEWNWKHVFVTPEQYASVNASVGVRLCVRKPAPIISVYADSMRPAA